MGATDNEARIRKGYAAFKSKLRVICHGNIFGEHTTKLDPPFPLLVDTFRPALDGKRWYYANVPGPAVPDGLGDEEAIREIWAGDS